MTLAKKLTLFGLLTSLLVSSVVVTVTASGENRFAEAAGCQHVGNHYTAKEATRYSSGIKEYWVCCKCHEHYLEEPSTGTWTEAGQAKEKITSTDDRYIPTTNSYTKDGFKLSADGKTITDYNGTSNSVVIPEGVETIGDGAFKGSSVSSVTLPSTLKEIEADAFAETDNLTSIVIPGSVEEIAANAFLDNPNGLGYFLGKGRNITIYLEITKAEADAKFESGWDNGSTSYFILGKTSTNKATVYYAGQWSYDSNGNPKPNKK